MTARAESIVFLAVLAVAIALFVALAMVSFGETSHGTVWATWPDQECRHVEPEHRFDCDRLPLVIDDIVWVSEEWKP